MQGNFVEISLQAKFLRKARNFVQICLHYFCTMLFMSQRSVSNTSESKLPNLHSHNNCWCAMDCGLTVRGSISDVLVAAMLGLRGE